MESQRGSVTLNDAVGVGAVEIVGMIVAVEDTDTVAGINKACVLTFVKGRRTRTLTHSTNNSAVAGVEDVVVI